MLWFRAPEKIYQKKGCLSFALRELGEEMQKKRAFIVTDTFLYANGYTKPIEKSLIEQGIMFTTFSNVAPDPTLACAKEGAKLMAGFNPDVIIAVGGGSAMDAAKIMWVLYEHPEADFNDMAMRFMDIRKRVYRFPKMGVKASLVCIPTSAGTGSEVTPFAVITDEKTGTKYPLADYELLPDMAIVDADMQMSAPPGLTSASGIDAVSHALEAYASMLATDYTDGLAIRALQTIFKYLPYGPMFYDEDTITDQPERAIVAELVREKALHALNDEIPHGIAVTIDRMKDRKGTNLVDIDATIICERDSHKGIIIGKGGSMLKKIGTNARFEIERLLDCKVNLKLWVKVKKDWRDSDILIRNFGYKEEE